MKKYRFRLDAVLRVRRIEEERAALQLAAAQATAAAAAERQRELEEVYATRRDPMVERKVAAYLAQRTLNELTAASVVVARHRAAAAVEEVDARRDEWSDAAGRVTGLERLDERGREEHRADVLREEAIVVDDLVTGRHGREERR